MKFKNLEMKRGPQPTSGKEGCPGESGVELHDIQGARSFNSANQETTMHGDGNSNLLEAILSRENLLKAYRKVKSNKGSAGVDGIETARFGGYLWEEWAGIKTRLLEETYVPSPVRRVEIPKPDGGTRNLGIPTLLDRMLQQAIVQRLTPIFDPGFSESSFGFRPGRGAHKAMKKAREHIESGYRAVVDIDLEKFFDRVNHDKLMSMLALKIKDKRVLRLIRRYLEAGVMENGVVVTSDEGTPQGGPMSPLLSNIMLDALDKELERRGHKFCRYADDCNIYVRSLKAGKRVMESITQFIETSLKLKVNAAKSAVDTPGRRKFLGFTFYYRKGETRIAVSPKSKQRAIENLRRLTARSRSQSLDQRLKSIREYLTGWLNFYKIADMKSWLEDTSGWLRRRVRMCIWKCWKKIRTRFENLKRLGLDEETAFAQSCTRKGPWRIAGSSMLNTTLTNERLGKLGLLDPGRYYLGLRSI